MPTVSPHIEVVPALPYPHAAEPEPDRTTPQRNRYRISIFAAVFLLSCLVGLGYTFLRPPVYQSQATLLIAPPAAFDESDEASKAQYLAVQRQVLTSQALLSQVYGRLAQEDTPSGGPPADVSALHRLLSAVPLEGASVLELRAEGSQREYLPHVLDTWIDVYLETYAASQQTTLDSTQTALQQQIAELEPKLTAKREELARFRERYDIVSMERNESEVLARLRGLTEALNKASQEEVTARSQLEALNDALAQGKPVQRAEDQAELTRLENQADELQEQLDRFGQRYTRQYMMLDPDMVASMRNLERIQEKIRALRQHSQQNAVAQAEQDLVKARQAVRTLQQQLDSYKRTAREFTTRFAEHQALQKELEQMEKLYQNVKEHLVKEETVNAYKAPRVTVLSRGSLPDQALYPHYSRDAILSLAGSVLLGLLAVLIFELLHRAPRPALRPAVQTAYFYPLPETRIVPQSGAQDLLNQAATPALDYRLPRELSETDVQALLEVADEAGRLLIGLLLSGLTAQEAAALRWQHIDLVGNTIAVPGPERRLIPVSAPLKAVLLRQRPAGPAAHAPVVQKKGQPLDSAELTALIACLAHDADLANPSEVTPQVLRHTYLAFLARQGVRLSELERIAGLLSPTVLAEYGAFSPGGRKVPLEQIQLLYPPLSAV